MVCPMVLHHTPVGLGRGLVLIGLCHPLSAGMGLCMHPPAGRQRCLTQSEAGRERLTWFR